MAYQKTSEFTVYSNHMDRLKNGRFEPIMVLLGGQDYLKFKYIELYKKQFHSIYPQGEILNKWSDQLKDASSIYELFSGGGLFSQQKLIILKNLENIKVKEGQLLAEILMKGVTDHFVVLMHEETWKIPGWLKELRNAGSSFVVDRIESAELIRIIHRFAEMRSLTITEEAIEYLLDVNEENLELIDQQIEKIDLLKGEKDRSEIDFTSVQRTFNSNQENDIYALSNAIIQRDRKRTIQILMELEAVGQVSIPWLVSVVYGKLAKVLIIKTGEEQASRLSLPKSFSDDYKLLSKASQNFTTEELRKSLKILSIIDYESRLGNNALSRHFSTWISECI
jgi:DNA polymerase III delta subunit